MGFAKYAEDNEEIMLERIRNRPYEWFVSSRPDERTVQAYRKADAPYLRRKEPMPCLSVR